jgi:hypothetical protein
LACLTSCSVIGKHAAANKTLTLTWSGTSAIEHAGDDGSEIKQKTYFIDSGVNWEFENAIWTLEETLIVSVLASTGKPLRDLAAPKEQYYGIGGRYGSSYNSTWLRTHSTCKPSETYQWGFSYIFLFMVSIFNFLWSFIMIAMWLDTRRGSCMYKSGRRPGFLRSVLDLATAVREELGPDAETLEEEKLRERLTASGSMLGVPKGELRVRRVGIEDVDEIREAKRSWTGKLTSGSTF